LTILAKLVGNPDNRGATLEILAGSLM